jgi:hypothetical protein
MPRRNLPAWRRESNEGNGKKPAVKSVNKLNALNESMASPHLTI